MLLDRSQRDGSRLADDIHMDTGSDSDLSEINEPPNAGECSSTTISHPDTTVEDAGQAFTPSDSSEDGNDAGSEDGEFEVDSAAEPDINRGRDGRSVSQQSMTSTKEEEFDIAAHMQEHPEVYDIRRSVSNTVIPSGSHLTNRFRHAIG
jgi:hypothetical protein